MHSLQIFRLTWTQHWDWSSYWKTDVPPPQVKPDWTPSTKLVGHWLAHASVLIEFPKTAAAERGVRVLCDPIWSTRCSPSSLVGPKRFTDSPINDDQPLPEVDLVVLSHNHYDHTDVPTLQKIYKSQPKGSLHFLVPLGNAASAG
jgi:N-acyl-phosphatidylethanolamine-hydrolysing phospholipase D